MNADEKMGRFETLRGGRWQKAEIGHAFGALVGIPKASAPDRQPAGAWSPWASIFDGDDDSGPAAAEHDNESAMIRQRLLEVLGERTDGCQQPFEASQASQPSQPSRPSTSRPSKLPESSSESDDDGPQDLAPSSSSSRMPEPNMSPGPGKFVPVSDVADNIVQNEHGKRKHRYLDDEQIFASFTSKRQYERDWRHKKKKKGGKKHKRKTTDT